MQINTKTEFVWLTHGQHGQCQPPSRSHDNEI